MAKHTTPDASSTVPMSLPVSGNEGVAATIDGQRLARNLFLLFLAIEIALVILDAFINYGRLTRISQFRRMFNIAREDGIGTWVASVQFLLAGITLWLICLRVRLRVGAKWKARGWEVLAIFFFYMSIDDAAQIHERLGSALKKYVGSGGAGAAMSFAQRLLDIFPSYAWYLAVGWVFGLMGIFMLWFLWREFNGSALRKYLLIGLGCFVFALGLDFLEGVEEGHEFIELALSLDGYTVRHFAKSLEEFIEMFGTTILLVGFLKHLLRITPAIEIRVQTET